jgi:hypothetical protein
MEKYKRIKFLSEGLTGKVYLVSKGSEKYAMKIEYIQSRNDIALQNELKFTDEVAKKYPGQFMQLVDYDIVSDCKEKAPKIPEWMDKREVEYFQNLRRNNLCVRKIYSLIDSTASKLNVRKMSLKKVYSMLIQLFYINYLTESSGFVHGDFHAGNMGVIEGKVGIDKKIKIFDTYIRTYGNTFVAIDYGGILHKSSISGERLYQHHNVSESRHFNEHLIFDKIGIINTISNDTDFWDFIKKNNIQMKGMEHDLKLINSQPEIEFLKTFSDNETILFELYRLVFTKRFQQVILGEKFKKIIPFKYYIPLSDIIFIYSNLHDGKKVINYLIARLEGL